MLDSGERKNIDEARDVLVGKIPDPKAQVEQITIGMIYKFMDDIDLDAHKLGGERKFFTGEFEKYAWNKLFDRQKSAHDVLNLYRDAIASMSRNPNIPPLFRQIFDKAFLSYNDPGTLKMFLEVINRFSYENPENLGNAFEYLLSILSSQGDAGQFRTPRNIIEFMVDVTDPQKNDRILDPACGTGGFLIYAWRHILKYNSPNFNPEKDSCSYENSKADIKDHVINGAAYKGENLTFEDRQRLMNGLEGYDISPDMVRLALVNMYLHDIKNPKIAEYDTLTSDENWNQYFDCVFSNPPFMSPKGGIRPHGKFSIKSSRSEVLFVDYIMNHLSTRGKAAVIVPEGIIFQSQNAYKELRKELVENYLIAVVSLPVGVFNPYSGVKTSVLLLDRQLAKKTNGILFVKVENDGYGLGAQRKAISKNDLPKSAKAIKAYKVALNKGIEFTPEEFDNALLTPKSKIAENGEYNLSGERYKSQSIVTTKYKLAPIKELFTSIKNGINVQQIDNEGKYRVTRIQTISNANVDLTKTKWTNDVVPEEYFMEEGDVLMSHINSIVHLAKSAIYKGISEPVVHGINLIRFKAEKSKVKPEYVSLIFKSPIFINKAKSYAQKAVNQASLRIADIKEIQIPLPPLSVQEEIVAEIEGYQKIIDGARQVVENWKPRIDIDPEWPMVELGGMCEIVRGSSPRPKGDPKYYGGNIPRLLIADVTRDGMYTEPKIDFLTIEGSLKSRWMNEGEIIIAVSGNPGLCSILKVKACIHDGFVGLRNLKNKINVEFLYYILQIQKEYNNLLSIGAVFRNLTTDQIKSLKIPLPPIEIQNQIVSQIEEEQAIVNGNKRLIEIYEQKIKDRIAKVWGE